MVASWPGGENCRLPQKFWTVGNCWKNCLSKLFARKCKTKSWKSAMICSGKIRSLSTLDNLLCRKCLAVCQKSVGNLQCLLENFNFLPGIIAGSSCGEIVKLWFIDLSLRHFVSELWTHAHGWHGTDGQTDGQMVGKKPGRPDNL